MFVRVVLALIGLSTALNGLAMLADPNGWYAAMPGVSHTGPANSHFIVDIGLAYLVSGVGLGLAWRAGAAPALLALAGAIWPALHAAFHIGGWVEHGPPQEPLALALEIFGVVLVGALGLALAAWNARQEGAI